MSNSAPLVVDDAERFAIGRQVLSNGLHRLYGTQVVAWDDHSVQLELPVSDRFQQQDGFVHGGVVAYLADTAMAFAAGGASGLRVLTSEFKLNFVRPAVGERLIARGLLVHAGRQQSVCRADLYAVKDGVEKLCAVAQGTIVNKPVAPAY